jgi:hypothetical protein
MLALNLPAFKVKMKDDAAKKMIFDIIRRKYVVLTPEEWVRQHFVHYLIEQLGYPRELLSNEVEVTLNATSKRCDTVLYDRDLKARMIIEYKATDVPITQKVFNQIMRYNMALHVEYLVVSNGIDHYCCRIDYATNSYVFLSEIPSYDKL